MNRKGNKGKVCSLIVTVVFPFFTTDYTLQGREKGSHKRKH